VQPVVAISCPEMTMNSVYDETAVDWLRIIRSEYDEMPGLQLTRSQAGRLWGLDDRVCAALLNALVGEKFLRLTADGRYTRTVIGRRLRDGN
jgi:hypothetical protein